MAPPKNNDPPNLDVLSPPLRALAARGVPRSYRKGTLIIEEGSQGDTLYLLLSGRVKAFSSNARGREVIYGLYGPGDYFGEMSLDGGPRAASVMAESACTCAVLTRQTLCEHIRAVPEFAFDLIARVIGRARLATATTRNLALMSVYERLVHILETESIECSTGGRALRPSPTHAQLAARLGCSREMVTRLMRDLIRGGYVRSADRSEMWIKSPLPRRW